MSLLFKFACQIHIVIKNKEKQEHFDGKKKKQIKWRSFFNEILADINCN